MDRPSPRDLLAATSALVAGILLPFDVTGARLSPDELETQAVALRQRVSLTVRSISTPPVALATAQTHYHAVNAALARSARPQQRRAVHRAASMTARLCALASRWCGIDGDQWLTIAEAEAKAAADGPLQAEA